MPVFFVKKHCVFTALGYETKVEGVLLDPHNKVEHIQDILQMEDACWLALDDKWLVLDLEMKIEDMKQLLVGDGASPDSAFEVKERVGGVIIDAASYVASGFVSMTSWMWPKKEPQQKQEEANQC